MTLIPPRVMRVFRRALPVIYAANHDLEGLRTLLLCIKFNDMDNEKGACISH
jgi:hypothetical protein